MQLASTRLALISCAILASPLPMARADETPPLVTEHFATSSVCSTCHSNSPRATAMRDASGKGIAPHDLWRSSMMANSTRDPLWRAVLSIEIASTPSRRAAIEKKCLRCHAPMASVAAERAGLPISVDTFLHGESPPSALAKDGVSCMACHLIEPDGLGTPESFGGGFKIGDKRRVYGPHDGLFAMPMKHHTGFTPTQGDHITESSMCATCHTLETRSYDADGKPTGHLHLEQSPYLEWQNSAFNSEAGTALGTSPDGKRTAKTCQDCHVPTEEENGEPIQTRIARNPGGRDFPPTRPRAPFGQHVFVGGNTLIPAILRDNAKLLGVAAPPAALVPDITSHCGFRRRIRPLASLRSVDDGPPAWTPSRASRANESARRNPTSTCETEHFDKTIAATRKQLRTQTAKIRLGKAERKGDELLLPVRVENLTGHKLPTGYPSRRVWIRLLVKNAAGKVVFASGRFDPRGRILDGEDRPLPSEERGGPTLPHRSLIESSDQVAVYEAVMSDSRGKPTYLPYFPRVVVSVSSGFRSCRRRAVRSTRIVSARSW